MRETSPFSAKQMIQTRKEKKSKSTLGSCEEFVLRQSYIHIYTLFILEIYRVAVELIYSRK